MGVSEQISEDWFEDASASPRAVNFAHSRPSKCHPDSDGATSQEDLFADDRLEQRDRLVSRLRREGDEDTAAKLEDCGTEIMLACVCCAAKRRAVTHCDRRYCPLCAPFLALERLKKTEKAILAMKWPLAITLTVKNKLEMTRDVFAWLLKCFKNLRRSVLWTRCVVGGFVACELTNRGKGWHPHLHILCDAEWLALNIAPPGRLASAAEKKRIYQLASKELEAAWCDQIGQMKASVHVRRKFGKKGQLNAAREAMKYAVKPGALLDSKGSAAQVIAAMKGTRLFSGFGNCYGLKLDDEPRGTQPCSNCGNIDGWLPEDIVRSREEKRREARGRRDRDERRKRVKQLEAAHRAAQKAAKDEELRARLRAAPKAAGPR
jgi:hypothetical protein